MRALKVLVIAMGLLIAAAFATLAMLVVGRVTRPAAVAPSSAQPFLAAPIELPPGAHIETMAVGSDRLVLDLVLGDGARQLLVIDLASGRRLGTILLHTLP